jgi:hypothetical protein
LLTWSNASEQHLRWSVSSYARNLWMKVACGLRLDDEGFHPTVLVYWRNRIRRSQRPRRVFDAVREVVDATGVLGGRRRRVLDSTVLEDAVATQDTVTQLVAAIRRVRRLISAARAVELGVHDYDRPGKPDCDWDDSDAKQALVSGLVNDALAVLAAVATPSWAPSRPRRWRCWRWSPARTWRRPTAVGRHAEHRSSKRVVRAFNLTL